MGGEAILSKGATATSLQLYLSRPVVGGELLAAKEYEKELLLDFKEIPPGETRDSQIEAVAHRVLTKPKWLDLPFARAH